MLTLFYATNTCSLASHISLEESGAAYEAKRLNFAENEQRKPEYLKINPKSRVPALVTDQGILTETPAILVYVAQMFPKANLLPLNDPFRLAQIQSFNSYLCSTVHVAHAHRMRGYRWTDDAPAMETMKKKVPQNVGDCFDLIERRIFQRTLGHGRRLHDQPIPISSPSPVGLRPTELIPSVSPKCWTTAIAWQSGQPSKSLGQRKRLSISAPRCR